MAYGDKSYGLRDVQIKELPSGSAIDLPVARVFSFAEQVSSADLRGDDSVAATVAKTDAIEFSIENGGISLEAWAAMTGRTLSTSGATPVEVKTYTAAAADVFPYFMVGGKSVGDGIDDVHVILYKCKVTTLEGSFSDQEFLISKCAGLGIDDGTNGIMDIIQHETATDISLT